MSDRARRALARLRAGLEKMPEPVVAVSGGVDSMTLAFVARRTCGPEARMVHAVSPAVPPDATARVRDYAAREGWRLRVLDAGEMADPRYLANPGNRCYFCKSNLYGSMSRMTAGTLLSGTNLDDLDDYRPGLVAAREHRVRHPYVESAIGKEAVRALSSLLQSLSTLLIWLVIFSPVWLIAAAIVWYLVRRARRYQSQRQPPGSPPAPAQD